MSSPVYCILSGGSVHCVPVTAFNHTNEESLGKLTRSPSIDSSSYLQDALPSLSPVTLAIKKRNLLYTLNNPSLSDLEFEVGRRLSTSSHTQDEDELASDAQAKRPAGSGIVFKDSSSNDANTPELRYGTGSHQPRTPGINSTAGSLAPHTLHEETSSSNGIIDIGASSSEASFSSKQISSILNEYSAHAVYLPQYAVDLQDNLDTNFTQIKTLLTKIFPSWSQEITIKQLTGGITNMLLSCTNDSSKQTLLMRVYGQGTNLIIDRNREFVSHLVLNSLKLAPPIHARFANGLIYGFLPGRSLDPDELSNGCIFPLIAQQLGRWHNSINCEDIEEGIDTVRRYSACVKQVMGSKDDTASSKPAKNEARRSINNVWDLIEEWISIVPANDALVDIFKDETGDSEVTTSNIREVIYNEFRWLKNTLKRATKSSIVVCHCDLLSGNIIVPDTDEFKHKRAPERVVLPPIEDNPVQFIDYEYMISAPRAFDIANHFAEWQGFDCNRKAIPAPSPSNPVMVTWCKGYLNDMNAPSDQVNGLINEIRCYYGMPGFYWGIWAMIQSEISKIDFNYAEYSKYRLEEYWLWKEKFLGSYP